MDDAIRRTIQGIHASPWRCVLAATGAGGEALAWLLRVPGASGTLLEAHVPYAEKSLVEFLGERPAHFVSPETAAAMAARSLERARHLAGGGALLGVGCTGALATLRARRGPHHACVAITAGDRRVAFSLELAKGARSRDAEEEICSRLLIHALALACGTLPAFEMPLLPGEAVQGSDDLSPLADLLAGRAHRLLVHASGQMDADAPVAGGILSGSFNPLHAGHRELAAAAAGRLGAPVTFELSLENVDKPPLPAEEALGRARQFAGWADLALSRAPTFREKARLFPGCAFVIGYDTAVRLIAPRYYASEADMRAALEEIRAQGCRFLVAGRYIDGAYHTLADVPLPAELRSLFKEIPEADFRRDISSTELRGGPEAS